MTPFLRSVRRGAASALTAMFAEYFSPSLRRRIALALAATFAVGYLVLLLVLTVGASWPILLVPAVVLALVPWGWWFVAGQLLRPLSATTETVRQLGPQNLGQRIRMPGAADPLSELADAIDEAMDRLAAGYEGQRRFAANASHELRTPLAVQRLLTEVAMDNPEASQDLHRLGVHLLRTNERSERLIEGLLVLAESDRGLPGAAPVRLDELAGSVIDAHQRWPGSAR